MRLLIPYNEFEQLLSEYFQQKMIRQPYNEFEQLLSEYFQQKMIRQIKLAYVDESTIQVSAVVKIKLKVAEATIPVKEKVSVKMVADSDITLTHAGMAYWNCVRMLLKTCWRYKTIIQC